MARLVLINGPPAIGKSTLARRYVADHPLALNLDIDAIRCSMGQWETHDESKLLARALAVEMAATHLRNGHDVVVPQLLGHPGFIEVLEGVATEAGAEFHEILLLAGPSDVLARFRARRSEMEASGVAHPQGAVEHDADTLAATIGELERIARTRSATHVVRSTEAVDDTYTALRAALDAGP